jgi:shikimate kinase/3-dehydroquinate synthase
MVPIYLIGMMGSGKTTIGKILSDILNKKFIDIDEEIEKDQNMKINEIFSKNGEKYFREIESRILEKTENENAIISTGGGIILKEKNRKILNNHKTLFLYVPVEELIKRIEIENRPLLKKGKEKLYEIWDKRKKLYEKFEKINLSNLNPYESAAKILYKILDSTEEVIKNDFQNVILKIKGLEDLKNKKNIFVSDSVNRIYGKYFNNPYILSDGEIIKNYDNLKNIYSYLIEKEINRSDTLVAVGGGTVTDLIGYVGATYKRGVKIIFYPTTLLAQVDASIGGKNAVDFDNIKNAIGTFYIPEKVIIDPLTIISQNDENYLEGIVEAFKVSLIDGNISLFIDNTDKILKRDLNTIIEIIKYSTKIKLDIVSKDPYDNKIRKVLNLGHTLGHAFESFTGISHGLSVGWGIIKELDLFSKDLKEKYTIIDFLKSILPNKIFNINIDKKRFMEYLFQDKKITLKGKIDIPIIEKIGNIKLKSIYLKDLDIENI